MIERWLRKFRAWATSEPEPPLPYMGAAWWTKPGAAKRASQRIEKEENDATSG